MSENRKEYSGYARAEQAVEKPQEAPQNSTKESNKRSSILATLPFTIVFIAVTVFAWIIPLRPTISEDEKRSLEKFPEFTMEALISGDYFDDIGLWFSDTFTGRETWLDVSMGVESLYGISDVVIYGDFEDSDDIPDVDLSNRPTASEVTQENAVTETAGQDNVTDETGEAPETGEASSDAKIENEQVSVEQDEENANLGDNDGAATNPSREPEEAQSEETAEVDENEENIPVDTAAGDENEENNPADSTAEEAIEEMPDESTTAPWGGEVISEDEFVATGRVIQIGDTCYAYTGFNTYYSEMYASSVNKLMGKLGEETRVFVCLAPKSTTFMLTREDRESMNVKFEEDAIAYVYSLIDSRVHCVNPVNTLIAHNSEYLAFRSDHHLTQLGCYYIYTDWCKEAGFEPVDITTLESVSYEGYLGTYYSRASKSKLIAKNPDTVTCYYPNANVSLYINDGNGDELGLQYPLISDRTNSSTGGKYLAFLRGDHARCTLINEDITDDSACMVLKTSVGNPFVYFLSMHYKYVYVIDIRYYWGRSISSFVNHFEVDDVIFMHGVEFAMGSGGNEIMGAQCK